MDLLIMLLVAIIITAVCAPYLSSAEGGVVSITNNVLTTSTFVAEDLPYCDVRLCQRVKCFTYYQEVLGLWRS